MKPSNTTKSGKHRKIAYQVLLYTLIFARSFGIFCCFCLISYYIPGSSWYTYHFIFKNLSGKSRTSNCCIRWCSLVLFASSAVYALNPITYLAVRGIHIISSSKIEPENRVLLYTFMFARAFGIFRRSCFNYAGICTFPRLPCPCTKRHVLLNLTSTGVCNTGTSALYV